MTNREEPVPADQFDRVLKEMRELDRLVGEVHEHVESARGISKYEAQRALNEASACIEVAQYWIGKALRAARGATDDAR